MASNDTTKHTAEHPLPWRLNSDGNVIDASGEDVLWDKGLPIALACVNACAGIDDPAAFIKAARSMAEWLLAGECLCPGGEVPDEFLRALGD